MAIAVGDRVPASTLKELTPNGIEDVPTDALLRGRRVVLFAVPGAFTPTCSAQHLPGYIGNAEVFAARGVAEVVCVSVNDPFVMAEWSKDRRAGGKIRLLADGSADFTRAMGLEFDGSRFGMGVRSQRYAAVIDDGVVSVLHVDEPGKLERSRAEAILEAL